MMEFRPDLLSGVCLAATLGVSLLFLSNLLQFRRAPRLRPVGVGGGDDEPGGMLRVSVLIPAE